MISVTLTRAELVEKGACQEGLGLFDKLSSLQGLLNDGLYVEDWTPLHSVWAWKEYSSFAYWCEQQNLIPRANLSGADLSRANLSGADLSRADLSGADLSRANLYGANLYGANLYGADLSGADLYGANLYGANLYGADLSGADLYRADLSRADLSRADLYGANLYGADLSGADLSGAYRGQSSIQIPGWRTSVSGYLEKDS